MIRKHEQAVESVRLLSSAYERLAETLYLIAGELRSIDERLRRIEDKLHEQGKT